MFELSTSYEVSDIELDLVSTKIKNVQYFLKLLGKTKTKNIGIVGIGRCGVAVLLFLCYRIRM